MEITTLKKPSRKPYIYKVTNLETGQYYIGSQCRGKIIGHNYFTSSTNKVFTDEFKTYRDEKYKIEIIKEFEDPDECGNAENYMIRDHMLLKDGLCLNLMYRCNGKKVFSRVGTHLSEEHKKKISISRKGTHLPEETKKKISIALKGRPSQNKGRPSPRRIKISIEGTFFNSLNEASKYYNVSDTTIRNWIKTKKHNAKKT